MVLLNGNCGSDDGEDNYDEGDCAAVNDDNNSYDNLMFVLIVAKVVMSGKWRWFMVTL